MASIVGHNFLISVALTAESPTQAAKTVQLMGYSRDQVRAVRNAAALKRDAGIDAFNAEFQPYTLVPVEAKPCRMMTVRLSISKTYEERLLNVTEFNEVADFIKRELGIYGIEVEIEKRASNVNAKSSIFTQK